MKAKAGQYRRSELRSLGVTISARYRWSVARQLTPFHYVIGISGILPYNRNVTLQTLELFSAYARLYNAAASPTSRLRSAGSLAMSSDTLFVCACVLLVKKSTNACKAELTSWSQGMTARKIFTNKTLAPGV